MEGRDADGVLCESTADSEAPQELPSNHSSHHAAPMEESAVPKVTSTAVVDRQRSNLFIYSLTSAKFCAESLARLYSAVCVGCTSKVSDSVWNLTSFSI